MDNVEQQPTVGRYRPLGIIANPYLDRRHRDTEDLPMALEIQSQANMLLAAVDAAATADRGATFWLEKSDQVHGSYHRSALIETEKSLLQDEDLNVLHAYVQLFAAKVGRIRSVLNVIAERLATRSFDRTLAAWLSPYIATPDTELPEWEAAEALWDDFAAEFDADPLEALAEVLGPNVMFRAIEVNPPVDLRPANLEEEPEENDSSVEDDETTSKIPEPIEFVDEDEEVVEAVTDMPDPIFEYLVALARKTLSPVIARGIRVYADRGAGPLSEELKITKAPRKTLKVLARLANLRFRRVVIVFDGYDNWNIMPEELRAKYVGALSEMRLLLGSDAIMVFMVNTGEAPEMDEMFGGSNRMMWDFPNLSKIKGNELAPEIVESWMACATIPGVEPGISAQGLLDTLGDDAANDLSAFATAAAAAIEDLVEREG